MEHESRQTACTFAAAQPTNAPNLKLFGIAIGGIPADLDHLLLARLQS